MGNTSGLQSNIGGDRQIAALHNAAAIRYNGYQVNLANQSIESQMARADRSIADQAKAVAEGTLGMVISSYQKSIMAIQGG